MFNKCEIMELEKHSASIRLQTLIVVQWIVERGFVES